MYIFVIFVIFVILYIFFSNTSSSQFEQSSIQSHLHTYHADSVPKEEVPQFCKNACRIGLKKLNMDQPVSIVNVMPNEQAPASGGGKSAVPAGMENLSPEGLTKLQEIMEGIQNERPDMAGIEKALGDAEVGPVLKTILASPQVSDSEERSDELGIR